MKKQILMGLILVSSILTMNAQTWSGLTPGNIYYNQGNVGIGTIPSYKLHVNGRIVTENEGIHAYGDKGRIIMAAHSTYYSKPSLYSLTIGGAVNDLLINPAGGNVGIGTTTPVSNLEIANSSGAILSLSTNRNNGTTLSPLRLAINFLGYGNGSKARITATDETYSTYGSRFSILVNDGNGENSLVERLTILQSGSIGIGTTSPTYKLDVCGTIRAKEVIVDLNGTCAPDFVFKNNYKLMDLKTLEQFVNINQHLPEIASEKEMVENGVNVKELQMKLLQKMEEMTLYMIEQNKKLEQQNEKIMTLENEIKELKTK